MSLLRLLLLAVIVCIVSMPTFAKDPACDVYLAACLEGATGFTYECTIGAADQEAACSWSCMTSINVGDLTQCLDWCAEAEVAAVVGEATITRAALDARSSIRLLRLKNDEYTIELSVLNDYIDDLLLSQQAASRGLSVAELLKLEVTDLLPEVMEAEAR